MDFSEIDALLSTKPLTLEMGIKRLPTGALHVASRSDMRACKGHMLDWWFGFLETAEHYRWWHPQDHKGLSWDDGRVPGKYIGSTCIVDESLSKGGQVYRLHIRFDDPGDVFPEAKLKDAYLKGEVSALICATIGFGDQPALDSAGRMVGGRLIHAAYDTPTGCALRSRFWLGWGLEAPPSVVEQAIPDQMGLDLMQHASAEYTILSRFLPSLYYGDNAQDFQ